MFIICSEHLIVEESASRVCQIEQAERRKLLPETSHPLQASSQRLRATDMPSLFRKADMGLRHNRQTNNNSRILIKLLEPLGSECNRLLDFRLK